MDPLLGIDQLTNKLPFLRGENFNRAGSGTHHSVYVSENYVIRQRLDNQQILIRETLFLKQVDHPLIPKVIWSGKLGTLFTMIENRLPGKILKDLWINLNPLYQHKVVEQIIEFLHYLRNQKRETIYSIKTGRHYRTFFNYLASNSVKKNKTIRQFPQSKEFLRELEIITAAADTARLLSNGHNILIHGDLINHNILIDGKNITGIIDWELSLQGDYDYDISRLFYYYECAKAYDEQGYDSAYEKDYMAQLTDGLSGSGLIENPQVFKQKNRIMRAFFYQNALYWAATSDAPEENIHELVKLWNKTGLSG